MKKNLKEYWSRVHLKPCVLAPLLRRKHRHNNRHTRTVTEKLKVQNASQKVSEQERPQPWPHGPQTIWVRVRWCEPIICFIENDKKKFRETVFWGRGGEVWPVASHDPLIAKNDGLLLFSFFLFSPPIRLRVFLYLMITIQHKTDKHNSTY